MNEFAHLMPEASTIVSDALLLICVTCHAALASLRVSRRTAAVEIKNLFDADHIRETQSVWSKHYGRAVSAEEATEILVNVKRLAELLVAHRNGSR